MKKQTLTLIVKSNKLTNFWAFIGIFSLVSLLVMPFLGFTLLAFLSAILAPISFVFMSQFESQLENGLKQAKNELGISIFTDNKILLNKCLSVYKSL